MSATKIKELFNKYKNINIFLGVSTFAIRSNPMLIPKIAKELTP
jgi:hypothetical protein